MKSSIEETAKNYNNKQYKHYEQPNMTDALALSIAGSCSDAWY